MTELQLLKLLRKQVRASSLGEVAKTLSVTPQYLCDVLKGRRGISDRLASNMGFIRRVTFEPKR
jgi:hypothetical protein